MSSSLDESHPWPGLFSFAEEAHCYFFGRADEIRELLKRVRDQPLTVLFGQSGLGKTSLVQAGLFPKLREEGYLPVKIRLDFPTMTGSDLKCDLRMQIRQSVAVAVEEGGDKELGDLCRAVGELWEIFHDVKSGFLKPDAPRVVLFFDQFEELFTKGDRVPDAVAAFISELAGLVENRPSSELSRRIDEDEFLIARFNRYQQPCKIILILREDYLGRLERYRREMPSLMHNRVELCFLKGPQALEAVLNPGKLGGEGHELLDEKVAEAIVRLVAKAPGKSMEEIEAVPSWLLSLMCRELNERRIDAAEERIREESLSTSITDILKNFYESSFRGLHPAVRHFVEERLLSRDANRESLLRTTAVSELRDRGLDDPEEVLNALISDKRLLAQDEHGGRVRIELAHDLLTEVAKASREREQSRIAEERQSRELEAELDGMVGKLKGEWRCPTAGARPLIEEYTRKLTETDRFDAFGERLVVALVLAAENLFYVHAYIKEGLEAAKKALRVLGYLESESPPAPRERSNTAAAALCTYAKGLLETGKLKAAKGYFRKALNCFDAYDAPPTMLWDDPFFIRVLARLGIGDILWKLGYRNQAIKRYDQVLEQLGRALEKLKDGIPDDKFGELRSRISLYEVIILLAKGNCIERGNLAQHCYDESKKILDELDAVERKRNESKENLNNPNGGSSSDAYREYLAAKLAYGKGLLSFNSNSLPFDVRNIPEALRNLQDADRRCSGLLKGDSQNWMWCSLQAEIYWRLGLLHSEQSNEKSEAEFKFLQMEKVASEVEKAQPEFIAIRYLWFVAHYHLYLTLTLTDPDFQKQLQLLNEARDKLQKLIADAPGYARCERSIALVTGRIGQLFQTDGQWDEALQYFEEALASIRHKAKKIQDTPDFQEVVSWLQTFRGAALHKKSRVDEAIRSLIEAAVVNNQIARSEPSTSRYLQVASAYLNLADVYLEADDKVNAIASYESAAQACDGIPLSVELMERKGRIYLAATDKWKERSELFLSCEALINAATVLEEAFSLDPVNYGLCKLLMEDVKGKSTDLLIALSSDGASVEGSERVDEVRSKIAEIEKRTQLLLYPRPYRTEEGMLQVSEPQTWTVRPLIAGSWITLMPREQDEELKRLGDSNFLNSEEKSLLEKILRIRKLRLPCYDDVDLFEAEVKWPESAPRIWTYLRTGDRMVILNGKSDSIHSFNKEHRLRLESPFEAATYFRFFCGAITGPTTFRIVDSTADVSWLPSATAEKIERFQQIIYPLRLKQELNADWSARCTIVFETTPFYALMELSRSGIVQMPTDAPIGEKLPIFAEYIDDGLRFFAPLRSDDSPESATATE